MSRGVKVLLIAGGLVFALAFNATLLAGIVVYRAARQGTAVVKIHEKAPGGVRLSVPVPVALVNAALYLAPRGHVAPLDPEARRWLNVARVALTKMEDCPDAVLVEVRSPDEHIVIAKRGGDLVVELDDHGDNVEVSVPAGALDDILDALASQAESSSRL
jgi:hypothetical protein